MYKSRKENGHSWFRRPYQPVSQFVPLSVVLTNDLSGIEFWTGIVTILAAFVALTSVRLSCLTF